MDLLTDRVGTMTSMDGDEGLHGYDEGSFVVLYP